MPENKPSEGGFSIIPNWVIRESDLTKNELLVYMALLNRMDSGGYAWPSISTLARESRSSARTVQTTLKTLEQRELVQKQTRRREDGSNYSNRYRVAVFSREAPNPGCKGYTPRVQGLHEGGAPAAEEEEPLEEDPREEDLRPKQEFGRATPFSFVDDSVTDDQLAYLRDLNLHHNNELPSEARAAAWRRLTRAEASELIGQYLRVVERHDSYQGPELGESNYDALSDIGKLWADVGMIPQDVGELA
ncbi:helix-turn-helix domain-containing protein [Herbiconiux daphne]|uniref:Helix-turn-helix domain-containing protein n=1 Tax=Herbiconiux daphne TaxID=2970914 RepID=A0ABT2GWP7_9MICO|nr:helix-turn-helix domain-containing protein [Herbiconiux daphne]MCS5732378.1 helix-turn-helix domain-containing protein [Herbiconiux daphne]